ncbi:MAG: transketolase family protein [Candidatus Aureabacteria bacterium]|nr:transketolase family protein [Candidatus Auribacterota bacterium]
MAVERAIRDGYGEALLELGKRNRNVLVLDADLAESTRSSLFARAFPERFFNTGVAEQNMVNMAVGLALCGKIVFASSFAIFATGRCWEQLRNSLAATRANVKIVASHGGITVGADGFSHQCVEDISLIRTIPFFTVIIPCDWLEAKKAVLAAAELKGPVYIRTSRPKSPQLTEEGTPFIIGKSCPLREGKEVTIVACGLMVAKALDAARALAGEGIEASVVNMHTIKPLDVAAVVHAARTTGAIVTAEEHTVIGGLGSAVAEVVAVQCPVPIEMVGIRDKFGQSGEPDELLRKYGLTAEEIYKAAKRALSRKRG